MDLLGSWEATLPQEPAAVPSLCDPPLTPGAGVPVLSNPERKPTQHAKEARRGKTFAWEPPDPEQNPVLPGLLPAQNPPPSQT